MEVLGFFWIPNILLGLLFLIVALYLYSTWTHSKLALHGYKGPKPKPFIGNIDLLLSGEYFGDWDGIGKKTYGKIFSLYEGRIPTLVVFEPDILKEVMIKQFSNFVDRRDFILRGKVMRHSLFDTRGSIWKRMRTLTTPFFTTSKLRKNMPCLEICVNNFMKCFDKMAKDKDTIELKDFVGAYTMDVICLTAFGVQVDSNSNADHPLILALKKMASVGTEYWGFWVGFMFPVLVPLMEWLGCSMWPDGTIDTVVQLSKELIRERRQSEQERPDFLQMLLKVHEKEDVTEEDTDGVVADPDKKNKPLTEDEVIAQVAMFMLAGYDTTSAALSFLLFQLAAHPECQERLLEEIHQVIGPDGEVTFEKIKEMTYLDMCFDESLRIYPPALRVDRKCVNDTTVGGYFVPKDTLVTIPIMALHRDPEYWEDPEKFDPERFSAENRRKINPFVYQPFGAGPRVCVGMRLALLETRYAVINIIRRYKLTVSDKTHLPIKLEKSFMPKVQGGLWVNLERR